MHQYVSEKANGDKHGTQDVIIRTMEAALTNPTVGRTSFSRGPTPSSLVTTIHEALEVAS